MPLRKQNNVPKMPRTRKKTLEKLKSSTPLDKKSGIEYIIKVFFNYDSLQKKQFYVVGVQTIKEFSYLNYEVSVDVKKEKDSIDISILGLNTRQTYFVEPSSAKTELFFEGLIGKYTINIIKQDGSINSGVYDFNIYKKEIILLETVIPPKKNNRLFCTFDVDHRLSSFATL